MAKAFTFTNRYIDSLIAKDTQYRIREARGFAVRVLPRGTKTFVYLFTLGGKKQELSLGTYPQVTLATAREKYQAAYTKFKNGIDPRYVEPVITEPAPELTTFQHFADLYLTWSEQHHSKDAYKVYKYSLVNDVLPYWKDTPLLDIRKRDAITLLERVALRAPGQAPNVQKAARGVFQYAINLDYTEYNPMLNLQKVIKSLKYVPKDRVLTDEEIKILWPQLPAHIKLILVTAQRPGEVAGLHSREIQVGVGKPLCATCRRCGLWTIPKERAKKGKGDHMVYLTPLALSLIGNEEGYTFPSPKPDKPIERMALSRYVHRNNYFNLPKWGPHDLRRTARTHMAKIGVPEAHAEAVLNHCKQGMVKVYNKYEYQEEKQAALLKWEAELLRIVAS